MLHLTPGQSGRSFGVWCTFVGRDKGMLSANYSDPNTGVMTKQGSMTPLVESSSIRVYITY